MSKHVGPFLCPTCGVEKGLESGARLAAFNKDNPSVVTLRLVKSAAAHRTADFRALYSQRWLTAGDLHPSRRSDSKAKRSATNKAKGEEHWSKRPEVRAKKAATQKAKGPAHSSKRPEVRLLLSLQHSACSWRASKPEIALFERLDSARFEYTGLLKASALGLPISSDITCREYKLLILVDGCYWHECPVHGCGRFLDKPASDALKTAYAEAAGWAVLRFWEHEISDDLDSVIASIEQHLLLKEVV